MARSGRGHVGGWIRFSVVVVKPTVALFFKRRWRGREHVPPRGGVILATNHVSHADWLTFACYVWDSRRIPRFLIKHSLFGIPAVGGVLRGAEQIPVVRGTSDARRALDAAVDALARGECVCIYPEGTVTKDPDFWPMQARTGVARLALSSDVPVIPVAQWGPQHALDVARRKVRPFPRHEVWTVAGPPLDLTPYRGRPVTAELLHEVTELVMVAVRDLLAEVRQAPAPAEFYPRPQAKAS